MKKVKKEGHKNHQKKKKGARDHGFGTAIVNAKWRGKLTDGGGR
jgi:hypothetical protein